MTVEINPEQEQLIGEAIQAGVIGTVDEVIALGVETIRQRLQAKAGSGSELSTEEWLLEFRTWVHSHSPATPLLSDEAISRDSIYGNRGM
jgi:hypothetical protein